MPTSQIRIRTEGFRAIGKADIIINGITVVAGENGSGKSTLSKLLYHLYKTASNYELLVSQDAKTKLNSVYQFLDIAHHELPYSPQVRNLREELMKELRMMRRNFESPLHEQYQNWNSVIKKTAELYKSQQLDLFTDENKSSKRLDHRLNRLRYIMKDIMNVEFTEDDKALPFGEIEKYIDGIFKEAEGKLRSRPTSLFTNALRNVFTEGKLPEVFDVMEFEEQIVSLTKTSLSIPYLIQNVFYIDTPMMVGEDSTNNEHWDDLDEALRKPGILAQIELSEDISKQIIHGEVSLSDQKDFSTDFQYVREDGSIYNLLDCATGVKAFAILQLLLKNGLLTNKTLLIIDEPESHLHPQWIIEYARLIVLLNKIVGVKFFIASHNPDMVSALKHISGKMGVHDNLNFYLSEKRPSKYLYDYKHLGREIDPIFESFNIALERIHQYGN